MITSTLSRSQDHRLNLLESLVDISKALPLLRYTGTGTGPRSLYSSSKANRLERTPTVFGKTSSSQL